MMETDSGSFTCDNSSVFEKLLHITRPVPMRGVLPKLVNKESWTELHYPKSNWTTKMRFGDPRARTTNTNLKTVANVAHPKSRSSTT